MYHNWCFPNVSVALPRLLALLQRAPEHASRAGATKELMHVGITLTEPWRREVLVGQRKPNIAAQIFETMWVLSGRHDMESLTQYLPRAMDFSDDGKTWRAGYGARLRCWSVDSEVQHGEEDPYNVDQLKYVVNTLKADPNSRQAVMSIWDPFTDSFPGKDIPCNNWLSFSIRDGLLDLHVGIRSNDVIWGWSGINAFEWSALQEIVAGLVGVRVGSLHFSTTSFHLYERHFEKTRSILDWASGPYSGQADIVQDSPRFLGHGQTLENFDKLCQDWFEIEAMIRTGSEPQVGSYIGEFPEPMLRSWLLVLQWWWTGERAHLEALQGTRLELGTHYSVQPPERAPKEQPEFDFAAAAENYARCLACNAVVAGGEHDCSYTGCLVCGETNYEGHPCRKVAAAAPARDPRNPWSTFAREVTDLHDQKHGAYGDSWKRRGEMLGIMANIGRKIDRLGAGETDDETQADTAADLLVYLAKYRTWLLDHGVGATGLAKLIADPMSDHPRFANQFIFDLDYAHESWPVAIDVAAVEEGLKSAFENDLVRFVESGNQSRHLLVDAMMKEAYLLARTRWDATRSAPTGLGATHAARNAARNWNPEPVAAQEKELADDAA